jgi:hypothetical protein
MQFGLEIRMKYEIVFASSFKLAREMYLTFSQQTEKMNTDPDYAKRVQMLQSYSRPGILCTNLTSGNRGYIPLTLEKEGNQQLDLSKFDPQQEKYIKIFVDHKKSFLVPHEMDFLIVDLSTETGLSDIFYEFAGRHTGKIGYFHNYFKYKEAYLQACKWKEELKGDPKLADNKRLLAEMENYWGKLYNAPGRKPWVIWEDRLLGTIQAEVLTHDSQSLVRGGKKSEVSNYYFSNLFIDLELGKDCILFVENSLDLQKEFADFCAREED